MVLPEQQTSCSGRIDAITELRRKPGMVCTFPHDSTGADRSGRGWRCRATPAGRGSRAQAERRVLVGDERQRVADHPVVPPDHALDEAEQAPRVPAGEEDGEPRPDHRRDRRDVEEEEDDVVGIASNHFASGSQRLRSRAASG